jgi:succinate-semialdehyde dehydrogenase/glutarate-semialdehyde dehydrogenase
VNATITPQDTKTRSGSFIGGRWRPPTTDERVIVMDPALDSPLAEFGPSSADECREAVAAAADALEQWSATPPRARGEVLRRAFELMIAERDELAELIVRENGKALADAAAEVDYAAEFFRWFAEEAVRVHGDMRRAPSGDKWIMVTRESTGVALLITPWNYPAAMATRKLGPALAAGCTVVLKPALETPLTAFRLVELLERAGVPPGVVNVVTPRPAGPGVERMLRDPRVRVLSFTGSTEVGRLLLATAALTVIRCSMELGGNAPFLVLEDADVEDAVAGLMVAKLRNGGSACTAANRVFVADAIADEFIEAFIERMRTVAVGHGLSPGVELGSLVNAETLHKVRDLVAASVERGATAVEGERPDLPGCFHPPTVLTGVRRDDPILGEEIFGPVAPIVRFSDLEEAIGAANASEAGLIAYAYTRDLDRGLYISRRLRAGMVGINRGVVSDPAAPFGGVKQSGLGREGASQGIEEFLDVKYTAVSYR